jgi:undecaprenyl-diphosphatase
LTWIEAIALGMIQGLTEFLPVSSSGHLVLLQNIFGYNSIYGPQELLLIDTMLHVGTLAAVALCFYKEIWQLIRHPLSKKMGLLLLATIPAVIFTLFLGGFIDKTFQGGTLGYEFFITGGLLLAADAVTKRATRPYESLGWLDATVMGVMQAVSILPGISRSGATIAGGVWRKLDKVAAARFAFLMSIPAILGAIVSNVWNMRDAVPSATAAPLPMAYIALGAVFAAICGIAAIKGMLKLLEKHSMWGFAIYVFIMGTLVLLDQFSFHIVFTKAPWPFTGF